MIKDSILIAITRMIIHLGLVALIFLSSFAQSETNYDLEIHLGLKYLHGAPPDIEKNIETARNLFYPAAMADDPIAQFFLTTTYDSSCFGKGPQCEYEKWLIRAAENGEPTAELLLGLSLFNLGETHFLTAIDWVRKSTVQGHRSAKIELSRLLLEAISSEDPEYEISTFCELFRLSKPIMSSDILSDYLSASCNFISHDQFIDAAFSKSESGSVGASIMIGYMFELSSEDYKALKYYRVATTQMPELEPSTYLESQIAIGVIDLQKEVNRIEGDITKKQASYQESRLQRLLAQQTNIDASYKTNEQKYEESVPEKPLVRFLKKAAHITLYAIATGIAAAADDYANQTYESDDDGYRRPSPAKYSPFVKPANINSSRTYNNKYTPRPAYNSPSCRCACVDGQQISLCTSAVAVPAICTGVCPPAAKVYQLPSVAVPPPGTTRCSNKSVYNEATRRYESRTVCE